MIIRNALVYTEDHVFQKRDILIKGANFAEICPAAAWCWCCGFETYFRCVQREFWYQPLEITSIYTQMVSPV